MSKTRLVYECQACAHVSSKWLGKCPDCGEWNRFFEKPVPTAVKRSAHSPVILPQRLQDIRGESVLRWKSGIGELDRVLGGGLVPGSVTLIGGDPGIGKSTIVLQALAGWGSFGDVLYVSAEESPAQIGTRAERMALTAKGLLLLSVTSVQDIFRAAEECRPAVMVVDSIQMIQDADMPSAPGTVSQVRECSTRLTSFAKATGTPVVVIGHVTKDGAVAGPKILEHIVDTVLYFEGDGGKPFRILRAVKNRFGSTNEIGVFSMTSRGLLEVTNPSELFMTEDPESVAGSCVSSSMEGTRPIMIEIQALVAFSSLGTPRRTALGLDGNRCNLILAVLEKRVGLNFSTMDAYLSVVGGLKLDDPAVDLGIALAAASSLKEQPLPSGLVALGEIGLSGEIRAIPQIENRLQEAAKLGFTRAVIPHGNLMRLNEQAPIEVVGFKTLAEVVSSLF